MEQSLSERARQGVLRVVGDDRVKALGSLLPRHRGCLCLLQPCQFDGLTALALAFFWLVSLRVSRTHCGAPHNRAIWLRARSFWLLQFREHQGKYDAVCFIQAPYGSRALSDALNEVIWIVMILKELGIKSQDPDPIPGGQPSSN